ncbi:MAG: hypothetical protein ABIS14_10980 [Sphingomonas sp.]
MRSGTVMAAAIDIAPIEATRRAPHGLAAGLFVLVWLSCIWFGSFALNPNNATRLFGAIELVEKGDARIDRFETLTIDKARFGRHYAVDKAPGMTLMAMPAVWVVNTATHSTSSGQIIDITEPHFYRFLKARQQLAVATTSAVLTAFAAVLLFDFGCGLTGSVAAGLFGALGYALGSIVWGWSTTLFGHAPAAALLTIAIWAVWRGTSGAAELARWRYPVMIGAVLGWAVVIEFPTVISAGAIGLWALWRTRSLAWPARLRLYLPTVAAALLMLVPLALYNQIAFGTPFKLGYEGVIGFDGMQRGLFGLTYPKPEALFGIVIGDRRGLFWFAPVLLLGAAGLVVMIRARATRDLGVMAVAAIAMVLLVNASYVYWTGGGSTGPRHSVTAIPFLALGLAPLFARLRTPGARLVAGAVLGVSLLINLLVTATDMFDDDRTTWPLWNINAKLAATGKFSTLPSDWWGWEPWRGLVLYLVIALPLLWLIARTALRNDRRQA